MADFTLDMKVIHSFFDRPAVKRAVKKSTKGNLSKAGAFVRKSARQSMPRRKKIARPGRPPSAHRGNLKTGVVFAYDPRAESVVIGPLRYQGKANAKYLEFGGQTTRTVTKRNSGRPDQRGSSRQQSTVERLHYHKFPFMGPALKQEAPKFPDLWANTVR